MKTEQQTKTVSPQGHNNPLTAVVKVIRVLSVILLFLLIAHISSAWNVKQGEKSVITGPTVENALAAEQELTNALLANDPGAVGRLLDDDWAVISADGQLGDSIRTAFLAAIKSGAFTRKTMVLSEPRVRLYGNIALVTTHLATSGTLGSKNFDVKEVQTDVLIWRNGAWKSVLLHETKIKE